MSWGCWMRKIMMNFPLWMQFDESLMDICRSSWTMLHSWQYPLMLYVLWKITCLCLLWLIVLMKGILCWLLQVLLLIWQHWQWLHFLHWCCQHHCLIITLLWQVVILSNWLPLPILYVLATLNSDQEFRSASNSAIVGYVSWCNSFLQCDNTFANATFAVCDVSHGIRPNSFTETKSNGPTKLPL